MPRVYAYVDETGDRGTSAGSSPIFGMAAVLVPEGSARDLQSAVEQLRRDFNVPPGKLLSWKEYAKNHDRRRRAAEVLGTVPEIKVCYLYAKKDLLTKGSYRDDPELFYNYVAGRTFKSILWASRAMGASGVHVRFGHVKHHNHRGTKDYLENEVATDPEVPSHLVESLKWVAADRYRESQAADLFAGFLKAATWPSGDFGYVEPSYLVSVWPSIRNSEECAIPLGIMSMPVHAVLTDEPWFPCAHCKK